MQPSRFCAGGADGGKWKDPSAPADDWAQEDAKLCASAGARELQPWILAPGISGDSNSIAQALPPRLPHLDEGSFSRGTSGCTAPYVAKGALTGAPRSGDDHTDAVKSSSLSPASLIISATPSPAKLSQVSLHELAEQTFRSAFRPELLFSLPHCAKAMLTYAGVHMVCHQVSSCSSRTPSGMGSDVEESRSSPAYSEFGAQPTPSDGLAPASFRRKIPGSNGKRRQEEVACSMSAGYGALKKCEARIQRLARLEAASEALSDHKKWAQSSCTEMLMEKLKKNPFWPTLFALISKTHTEWLKTNKIRLTANLNHQPLPQTQTASSSTPPPPPPPPIDGLADPESPFQPHTDAPPTDGACALNLTDKASECSDEAAMELEQLRAVEGQAQVADS